jgi:hypothetical protein
LILKSKVWKGTEKQGLKIKGFAIAKHPLGLQNKCQNEDIA